MILTNVSDTIHADSLAFLRLTSNSFAILAILLTDVTKPEISNIPTLTRPVTSSVVKYHTSFGKFTHRAIEWRLNFGNRSSSLGDHGPQSPRCIHCTAPRVTAGVGVISLLPRLYFVWSKRKTAAQTCATASQTWHTVRITVADIV